MIMFGNANPNTKMYITYDDPSLESHAGAQLWIEVVLNCILFLSTYEYLDKMIRKLRKIPESVCNFLPVATYNDRAIETQLFMC